MKFVFAFMAIIALIVAMPTPEQLEVFEKIMTECKEKTNVSDEDVGLLLQHKVPETKSGKCFAACMKKKLGILNDDNKINLAKIEELITPVKANDEPKFNAMMKIFKFCAAEVSKGPDECEISAKFMECCIREFEKDDLHISIMSFFA